MSDERLQRGEAPFGAEVWKRIDEAVVATARARLGARRLLHLEGPYGLALQAIVGAEGPAVETDNDRVRVRAGAVAPVPSIESDFQLSIRDIAAFEERGQPLDLKAAALSAAACADQEDALIFNGSKALGMEGLLNAKGVQSAPLAPWKEVGLAVDNILQAVNRLDGAGFHGPYALALEPALFNQLFRCYPQGGLTELEHLRQAVTDGIVKTAAVGKGGVLVASVKELAAIVVGQDLTASFVGPSGREYAFAVSETVALRLSAPSSVCVLKRA